MKTKLMLTATAAAAASTMAVSAPAQAGIEPYLGEIMMVGYNFCPRGWASAEGQLLAISSNTALFSLYGTTFGGDGRTTFALPDFRGRAPVGQGQGPGTSGVQTGQRFGVNEYTLNVTQMPSHTHTAGVRTANADADSTSPVSDSFARTPGVNTYSDQAPNGGFMANGTVQLQNAGGNQSFPLSQPSIGIRFCVALQGTFPSRS